MQIRLNVLLVNRRLGLIGREHVDPVSPLGSLIRSHHDHAIGASLLRARAVRLQADDNLVPAVAQVLRLCMSLAAVAQDGDGLALQSLGISVVFVEDSSHWEKLLVASVSAGTVWDGYSAACQVLQADRPVGRFFDDAIGRNFRCQAGSLDRNQKSPSPQRTYDYPDVSPG